MLYALAALAIITSLEGLAVYRLTHTVSEHRFIIRGQAQPGLIVFKERQRNVPIPAIRQLRRVAH